MSKVVRLVDLCAGHVSNVTMAKAAKKVQSGIKFYPRFTPSSNNGRLV